MEKLTFRFIRSVGSVWSLLIHTILFIGSFCLYFLGANLQNILLVLTTIVSLEAIYLAIFIQMSVNFQTKKLDLVHEDMEDIQEDMEDIQEDVEDIQKDVKEIQKDVDEIQEDVEEIQEEDEEDDDDEDDDDIKKIKETLDILMKEVIDLKKQYKNNRIIKKKNE